MFEQQTLGSYRWANTHLQHTELSLQLYILLYCIARILLGIFYIGGLAVALNFEHVILNIMF